MNRAPDGSQKKCVGCYENKHWMKGDIIVDSYERAKFLHPPRPDARKCGWDSMTPNRKSD